MSTVVWFHAVNSQEQLNEVFQFLKNGINQIVMVEADILMGKEVLNSFSWIWNLILSQDDKPIMSHPPWTQSNLTFESMVDQIISASEDKNNNLQDLKTLKFDFKSPIAVEICLKILQEKAKHSQFLQNVDIWLNADILCGPGGKASIFDPKSFIPICQSYFPNSKLSIGWTTGKSGQFYSKEMIDEMLELCSTHSLTNITFPLKASLLKDSPECHRLLEVDSFSLTAWGEVDNEFILWVSTTFDSSRVFIDVKVKN